MKKKHNYLKEIFIAVVSSMAGILFSQAFDLLKNEVVPSVVNWAIIGVLVLIIIALCLIYATVSLVSENQAKPFCEKSHCFVPIKSSEISDFISLKTKSASEIRVVGIERNQIDSGSAHEYLDVTKLKLTKKSTKPFKYRRVTARVQGDIGNTLFKHIADCSKLKESKKIHSNIFEVIMMENIDFTVSYHIFDDTGLLLGVDNKITENGFFDNDEFCIWTNDKETIKLFIKRFEAAWQKHKNSNSTLCTVDAVLSNS